MDTVGERVKEAAKAVGGLNSLAKVIGMPRRTLGDQISGKFEVKLSFIVEVAKATGFSVNWLSTGEGEMFADPSKAPAKVLDATLMRRLADLVEGTFKEEGARIRNADLTVEAAHAYNDLLELVDGELADAESVEAAMPLVKRRLQKRLSEAASNPGSGKRSA